MKQLYFVRHGESVLNRQRIFSGQLDTPLTERGELQAKAAGEQAKQISIDVIVSSSLVRAFKTAQIIAEVIGYPVEDITTDPVFMERSHGSLEGKSWDLYPENDPAYQDIESDESLLARAVQGLEYLKSLEADTVLLVGHGSYSRALRTAIDPSQEYNELENGQIIRLL